MDRRSRWANGSTRWAAVVLGLAAAGVSAGLVPARDDPRMPRGSPTGGAPLYGEHSAAGERRVDALNRALGSMERLRGEHARQSKADYLAEGDRAR
jgi:hypothetical protein